MMKRILALIGLLLVFSFSQLEAQTPLTEAVDFTAVTVEGETINLFEILDQGKYVVIDFFFVNCGPCQQAAPHINAAHVYFGCNTGDVVFLAIDTGDTDEDCIWFDETFGVEYPTISGVEGGGTQICNDYMIPAYPTVILIAPNRDIVEQDIFPIPNPQAVIGVLEQYGLQQTDCESSGGFTAGFFANTTDYCEPPAVAQFTSDVSGGSPVAWNWWFEGGITSQGTEYSNEENPVVTYLEEGSYDVELAVYSTEGEWDTAYQEKYIGVHGLPDVYWEDVPELCNEDWAPYELTEGQPGGGVYSGDYIDDGMYFNADGLPAGQYEVTYTYMDEYGCENYAEYLVEVVDCVGLPEGEKVGLEVYPNPSSGMVHLNIVASQFNNTEIEVIDALGKEIYSQEGLNISGKFSTTIDLSSQPQGVYFVIVKGEYQRVVKKIFLND